MTRTKIMRKQKYCQRRQQCRENQRPIDNKHIRNGRIRNRSIKIQKRSASIQKCES